MEISLWFRRKTIFHRFSKVTEPRLFHEWIVTNLSWKGAHLKEGIWLPRPIFQIPSEGFHLVPPPYSCEHTQHMGTARGFKFLHLNMKNSLVGHSKGARQESIVVTNAWSIFPFTCSVWHHMMTWETWWHKTFNCVPTTPGRISREAWKRWVCIHMRNHISLHV